MKVKVFTLRPDPETGALDDAEVVAFLEDREGLSLTDHFFVHDGQPTLVLVLTWREFPKPAMERDRGAENRVDAPVEVPEADRRLYEAIRKWRNDRAKKDGRPAYIYLNNAQLAEVARLRPVSRAALEQVRGIGLRKTELFGDELLAVIAATVFPGTGDAS